MTAALPRTSAEAMLRACTACRHTYGLHFETNDRRFSGCAETIPMPSAPLGEERCICIGFDRADQ